MSDFVWAFAGLQIVYTNNQGMFVTLTLAFEDGALPSAELLTLDIGTAPNQNYIP